ncbi:MAG: response regulator transcription factor [Anaerolineaceae bacterium]
MRILLVDDEDDFSSSLSEGLMSEGYIVDIAQDGESALYLCELYPHDLVLLDLNLPDVDGLTLCEEFRKVNPNILICIVSARGELQERIEGLDQGADDYLSKPVHFDELLAHIRALTRRNMNIRTPLVEIGQLKLDMNFRLLFVADVEIKLTTKEYQLLEYLVGNRGRFICPEELILHIWGEEDAMFSNTVRSHISNLRKKMKEAKVSNPRIVTTVNKGYSLILD